MGLEFFSIVMCHRKERLIGWNPPMLGWVKLNTNGSSKDNETSDCGDVLQGCNGE